MTVLVIIDNIWCGEAGPAVVSWWWSGGGGVVSHGNLLLSAQPSLPSNRALSSGSPSVPACLPGLAHSEDNTGSSHCASLQTPENKT